MTPLKYNQIRSFKLAHYICYVNSIIISAPKGVAKKTANTTNMAPKTVNDAFKSKTFFVFEKSRLKAITISAIPMTRDKIIIQKPITHLHASLKVFYF